MALKNLLVKVGVSTKGLNADLRRTKNNFRRNFGEIQSLVKNTGRAMTASITAPLGLLAVQSVQAFNTQAKAIAQVEAGLKSTGAQVGFTSQQLQKMASDLQTKTLFGDEEILSGATAQLLTFTNISGEQFARTQKAALDLATRLDGDLKSASIQLGKALNDPIANLSALSRSGIQFSADQKEVIKALAETGRLAEAQTIILNELEKQYGGSAEAAAQAGTGGLKQLQNSLGDLQEEFGAIIMEMLPPLIDMVKQVAQRFRDMSPETKKLVVQIAGLAAVLGPVLMAFSAMMPAIVALLGPVGLLVAAIATAVGGFVSLARKIDKARNRERDMRLELERVEQQYRNNIKAVQDYHKSVDKTATIQDKLADMTLPNVEAALGRVNGQVKGMAMHMKTAIGQKDLDRIKELEESYKGVELFGLTPLEAAIADYRAELKKAQEEQDKAGAGAGVGLGDGDDMTVSVPRQADMIELTKQQATAIENVGAAATATLQPMTDWTQVVGDEQNLEAGQRFNEMLYAMQDAALELAKTIGAQLGGAFADMITGAKKSGEAFKGFAKEAIKAALAASQAHIIEAAISSGKMSGPLAMFAIPGLIAAGMGIVDAAFGDVAAFAAGGLVTGPVLGLVGEGPGTSRMNPEVIAPLDKLQSMMGGRQVQVTGMLRGADILLTNERAQIDRNRLRSF
jgi:hypothetical protein